MNIRFTTDNLNSHKFPVTSEIALNLIDLADKANQFYDGYQYDIPITSGLRDSTLQMKVNPLAPNSNHLTGKALDAGELLDYPNRLLEYVLSNLDLAMTLGLFFENPNFTPTWIHLQTVSPKSGHRIFIPNPGPALCSRWSGVYDRKYDIVV